MSYYSKVSSRFWTGNTGRVIRGDLAAQVVATYLVTSPHANMLGYYYLPIAYIANDTGLSNEDASKALTRLCDEGFCRYDMASEVVWIVAMARIQISEQLELKDKRVIGIGREYESIPNNKFLQEFFDTYAEAFHMKKARGSQAPSKPATATVAVTPATATTPLGDSAADAASDPWKVGKEFLMAHGVTKSNAGSVIGKWAKAHGHPATVAALQTAMDAQPADPVPYIEAIFQNRPKGGKFDPTLANLAFLKTVTQ